MYISTGVTSPSGRLRATIVLKISRASRRNTAQRCGDDKIAAYRALRSGSFSRMYSGNGAGKVEKRSGIMCDNKIKIAIWLPLGFHR